MRKWICFLFAALACVASGAHAAPVNATIAQILAKPDRYANQIVRLRGQIDNCISFTCHICPEDMTQARFDASRCLSMEFAGDGNAWLKNRTEDAAERFYRFATVTATGRFDPTCLMRDLMSGLKADDDMVVVCTDRATVLLDVHVEAVHSRKSALDGIVSGYHFGTLQEAPPTQRAEIEARLRDITIGDRQHRKIFLVSPDPTFDADVRAQALDCLCLEQSCERRWPTRWFGGFDSSANPFFCYALEEMGGAWRIRLAG